ncbi:unnamed protein product [Moneuplotes crassus]|uniref:Uncharacterized protein n=1 Tax=Euplotes crassus TaxID=5936 RepID=A0AAD1Y9H5_EUPCR|nr:unnamed protein product [Moneuplotes crassus]
MSFYSPSQSFSSQRSCMQSSKMNSSRASSLFGSRSTEPIDYEFALKVPTMSLSPTCAGGEMLKLRFNTQSNIHDVVLEADEVNPTPGVGTEVVFYSKVKIHTIMSFDCKTPQEKMVKITLQDCSHGNPVDICHTRLDLAESIKECMQDKITTVVENLDFAKNMGRMCLHITPKKLVLRDKVNMALAKPPVHTPISRMPTSPHKTPHRVFQENNDRENTHRESTHSEVDMFSRSNLRRKTSTGAKENWNDVSFCPPEEEPLEEDLSEGQCHYKTDRKKRSSSQITFKKPQGMGKIKPNGRPSQIIMRNEFDLTNKNDPLGRKGGSSIRSVIEDSVSKISGSDSVSNAFNNSIFTSGTKKAKKLKVRNMKDRYTREKNLTKTSKAPMDYQLHEPSRNLYKDLSEADRINKLSCTASESGLSVSENSMVSSVSSIPNFCEKDIVKNEDDKIEFVNKYQQAKSKEKKYRKELKVLKLERKQLQLKTEDVDQHLKEESHKIIDKAMAKINDKIEKSGGRPKMNKLLAKNLIGPLLSLCMADQERSDMIIELIRNGQNDGAASAHSVTPTKSVRSTKDNGKSKSEIEKLQKKIKKLETENKALRFDVNENSRLFEEQSCSLADERKRMKKVQKQLDSIHEEDKKEKEGINSKISNYKTRIVFLESQVEELDKKNKEFESKKKKDKKEQKTKISKIKEEKGAVEKKLNNLREKFEDLIENEKALKDEIELKNQSISNLDTQVKDLEAKLVELKTDLADKMYELEIK